MKKGLWIIVFVCLWGLYNSRPLSVPASLDPQLTTDNQQLENETVSITVTPDEIIQGVPVLVVVNGMNSTSTIRALKFHNKPLEVFLHNGRPAALIGVDLRLPPTTYPLTLTLTDGRVIQENIVVGKRVVAQAPLGIPESLGGNTPESEKELLETLVKEGEMINAIPTSDRKLWSGAFEYPLSGPIVITDTYGYSRLTGASTIAHKGTDFRAAVGTPVYAMNTGLVAFKANLRNYGNVVALDHGLGLLTIYMHLDEVLVEKGEMVEKGELIARSGQTGYVLGAHLHLTVRINKISIDPEEFLTLLGN